MNLRPAPRLARCLVLALALPLSSALLAQDFDSFVLYLGEGEETYNLELGGLAGPIESYTTEPASPAHVTVSITDTDQLLVRATSLGTDSVVVRYCDGSATPACDTGYFRFLVRLREPITASTVRDTVVKQGDVVTACADSTQLPGGLATVSNACPGLEGPFVQFDLNEATGCLKYRGLESGGIDTACVVLCDSFGLCDTTTFIVSVIEPDGYPDREYVDTIYAGLTESYVLDVSDFPAGVVDIANTCPDASGERVVYTPQNDNFSVQYSGLARGQEPACIVATDAEGRTQRFAFTVVVLEPTAARDTLRVRNGSQTRYCFGEFELSGEPVALVDACAQDGPVASVTVAGDDVTCALISADKIGTQEVCLTLCDAQDVCDTIELTVLVMPNDTDLLPIAVDDAYRIDPLTGATVSPLDNDRPQTDAPYYGVVDGPTRGTASFLDDGALAYALAGPYCGTDSLVYELCNDTGCDQAIIRFDVDCEGIDAPAPVVYQGFSPNGDGLNETFTLRNLEFYPRTKVRVYNRWGTRVFVEEDYRNDWDGRFGAESLPDGTYFYLVDFADGGQLSGYVQLRR